MTIIHCKIETFEYLHQITFSFILTRLEQISDNMQTIQTVKLSTDDVQQNSNNGQTKCRQSTKRTKHTTYKTYNVQNIQRTKHTTYKTYNVQNIQRTKHTTYKIVFKLQAEGKRKTRGRRVP